MSIKMKRSWFTLVELIVVITILAVLWTIAFVSLQGYSRDARDSKRISDVNSIRKVLEYDVLKKWYYILPENWVNVTYSTWWESKAVWQQWIFWESNRVELWAWNSLSKVPRDPLTNTYYTYSVLNTKKEIQIWAVLEWWVSYWPNLITDTYARWNEIWWSYIVWNYNGKVAKVTMWWNMYIFAVPSIISTDLWTPDILALLQNNLFAFNGTTKLPWSYELTEYNLDWQNELIVQDINQPIMTLWQPYEIDAEDFITSLQEAFSGTTISDSSSVEELLSLDTTNTGSLDIYLNEATDDTIEWSDLELVMSDPNNDGLWNPELQENSEWNGWNWWIDNWITVTCLDRTPWDTFSQNWVNYLVVSTRQDIIDNMSNINSSFNLCTSHVTDMSFLLVDWYDTWTEYSYAFTFNEDISSWDTSNVENFLWIFATVNSQNIFNQDIGSWDVTKVTDIDNFDYMFYNAGSFNQDLSSWDTSNASLFKPNDFDTWSLFAWNYSKQPWIEPYTWKVWNTIVCYWIDTWTTFTIDWVEYLVVNNGNIQENLLNIDSNHNLCTSNVTSLYFLFNWLDFNEDISSWDTSNVTVMSHAFTNSTFNQDIWGWNTSKVVEMWWMFQGNSTFNQDIWWWDMSKVWTTQYMFYWATAFNNLWQSMNWDLSSLWNAMYMFYNADSFNIDIWNWYTPIIYDMRYMFNNNDWFNQDISRWCVTNITSKPYRFDANSNPWFAWNSSIQPQWWTCPTNN